MESLPECATILSMNLVGLDIGFGYVKYVTENGKSVRFPSWIGIWTGYAVSDIKPIQYEGREYVVGYDARYCRQRIEVVSFEELLRYVGLFVEYVKREEGEVKVLGGLSARHYSRYLTDNNVKKVLDKHFRAVYPQGFGILVDVEDKLNLTTGEEVLVLDIGFNTLDYLIVRWDGKGYKRLGMDSVEGLGVLQAVEVFKKSLPQEIVGIAKNWSRSRYIEVFERGGMQIEGEYQDLSAYKRKAVEVYTDMLLTRLKEEVGEGIFEASRIVVGGGGANLIDTKAIREDVIVPKEPEFANARGYIKAYRHQTQ